jgi:low affinity Fe/Cu permease
MSPEGEFMTIVLGVIAFLLLVSVIFLKKFMRDMAAVESELIKELREMKQYLKKISEKQL